MINILCFISVVKEISFSILFLYFHFNIPQINIIIFKRNIAKLKLTRNQEIQKSKGLFAEKREQIVNTLLPLEEQDLYH